MQAALGPGVAEALSRQQITEQQDEVGKALRFVDTAFESEWLPR
ncbi:MAG: hypothetical protein QM733_08050 [Ilumatobacteraceae bacterium]